MYRQALLYLSENPLDNYNDELICHIWKNLQSIRNAIQDLVSRDQDLFSDLHSLFEMIGCDHNQCSNLMKLDYHYYEHPEPLIPGCDPYSMTSRERRDLFDSILRAEELKNATRDEKIGLVTAFYRGYKVPHKPHSDVLCSDVARFYMVVVLPDFIQKYDLLDDLIEMDDYRLLLTLIACALHEVCSNKQMCSPIQHTRLLIFVLPSPHLRQHPRSLDVPDSRGGMTGSLGCDSLEQCAALSGWMGADIGRYANCIRAEGSISM